MPQKTLSKGAIAGIAVTAVVIFLIITSCILIFVRRRRDLARTKQLRSPLDPRFGAMNITAPNAGAYSSPQASPPMMRGSYKSPQNSPPLRPDSVQMMNAPKVRNFSVQRGRDDSPGGEREVSNHSHISNWPSPAPPSYDSVESNVSGPNSLPAHHAYIPSQHVSSERSARSPIYTPSSSPRTNHHPVSSQPSSYVSSSLHGMPSPITQVMMSHHQPTDQTQNYDPTLHPPHQPGSPHQGYILPPPPRPSPTTSSHPPTPRLLTNSNALSNNISKSPEIAKKARERLYKEGFGGTMTHAPESPAESPEGKTPASAASTTVSQWPGTY